MPLLGSVWTNMTKQALTGVCWLHVTADMHPGIEALEWLKAIRCSPTSTHDGQGTVILEELPMKKKENELHTHDKTSVAFSLHRSDWSANSSTAWGHDMTRWAHNLQHADHLRAQSCNILCQVLYCFCRDVIQVHKCVLYHTADIN